MKGQFGDTAGVKTEVLRVLKSATKLMTSGEVYEAGQFEGPQMVYNALHAMSQVDVSIWRIKDPKGSYLYGMPSCGFEVPKPVEEKPVERVIEKETVGLDRFNKRFAKEAEPNRKFVAKTAVEIPTLVPKKSIRDIADKYVGPYAGAIKELETAMGAALLKADKCRVAIEALKAL